MKHLLFAVFVLSISGCGQPVGSSPGRYSLFETAGGVVYRLDTITGDAEILYSPTGSPKLVANALYEDEDGNLYEYLGNGDLKKLTVEEAADRILKKYPD